MAAGGTQMRWQIIDSFPSSRTGVNALPSCSQPNRHLVSFDPDMG